MTSDIPNLHSGPGKGKEGGGDLRERERERERETVSVTLIYLLNFSTGFVLHWPLQSTLCFWRVSTLETSHYYYSKPWHNAHKTRTCNNNDQHHKCWPEQSVSFSILNEHLLQPLGEMHCVDDRAVLSRHLISYLYCRVFLAHFLLKIPGRCMKKGCEMCTVMYVHVHVQ